MECDLLVEAAAGEGEIKLRLFVIHWLSRRGVTDPNHQLLAGTLQESTEHPCLHHTKHNYLMISQAKFKACALSCTPAMCCTCCIAPYT